MSFTDIEQWLSEGLQPGDIAETKELIPDVLDIEAWARKQKRCQAGDGKAR